MRLAGVAIGVSSAADPATAMSMSTGWTEVWVAAAAETAIGVTMRTVAVLLTIWPSTAVSRNIATISTKGPPDPDDGGDDRGDLVRRAAGPDRGGQRDEPADEDCGVSSSGGAVSALTTPSPKLVAGRTSPAR